MARCIEREARSVIDTATASIEMFVEQVVRYVGIRELGKEVPHNGPIQIQSTDVDGFERADDRGSA